MQASNSDVSIFRLHGFEDNLSHALSFVEKKSAEPKFLKNFLHRIYRYVKKLHSENPDLTVEEVEEIFQNDIRELSDASYCGAKISQNYMNYICYEIFLQNPDKLDELLLSAVPILEEHNYSLDNLKAMPRSTFNLTLLYYAAKLKNDYLNSGCSSDIHEFLSERTSNLSTTLVNDISDSIEAILTQLDKFGLLDSYLEMNKKKMTYLGFPELGNIYSSDDPEHKSKKLLELFSNKDIMGKYSPSELLTLYSFWINRYYKELDTYLEAIFAIKDFNLIPSMLAETFKSPSKDDLKKSLVKMNLFYDSNRFYLEMQKLDRLSDNNETELDASENIYKFSDEMFLHYVKSEFGNQYQDVFNKYLPTAKNDLEEDAKLYFNLYNPIFATYNLKDVTMLYLLIEMLETPHYNNAGIILPNNFAQSMNLDRFVGIGIDSGMNDSFSLHIRKDTITELLSGYMCKQNYVVPAFYGKADYTSGVYATPILTPVTNEQSRFVVSSLPSLNSADASKAFNHERNVSYLKHLKALTHYKNFEYIPKYVDLSTGEIFSYDIPQRNQSHTSYSQYENIR